MLSIITLVIIVWILHIGQSLIIPFIIAILLSIFILSLAHFFERFPITRKLPMTLSVITYMALIYGVISLISSNAFSISDNFPTYAANFDKLYHNIFLAFGYTDPPATLDAIIQSTAKNIDIKDLFTNTANGIVNALSNVVLIFFYVIFILIEGNHVNAKLNKALRGKNHYANTVKTITQVQNEIKSYFFYKTLMSLATGVLSYVVMMAFGLDYASFWALLIFMLNFIPNIGSIIGVAFPVLLSIVQFTSAVQMVAMGILLISVQFMIGNFIEPRYMSSRLNLSPLLIILCLTFWGALWGVAGMLLSVPIMVVLNIILCRFKSTRGIAIMLSEKGDINNLK
ncbi:MAG: AI-2E family transporter [Candidatus Gracilibacteria bacterium]|nr:AI-2E family transporter [Candidatus Gracilibacteria bacterium]